MATDNPVYRDPKRSSQPAIRFAQCMLYPVFQGEDIDRFLSGRRDRLCNPCAQTQLNWCIALMVNELQLVSVKIRLEICKHDLEDYCINP